MRFRLTALAAALCLSALSSHDEGVLAAAAGQEPTFRVAIDLIPVEVQVVDRTGQPVAGLTADQFEVTINGRKRRVASATLIDLRTSSSTSNASVMSGAAAAAMSVGNMPEETVGPPPRVFVLAVDVASFDEATGRPVIRAAADFVKQLAPSAEVGLFTYPIGPKVDPTTDRDAVVRALDTIIARRETPPPGRFNLSPTDLVELSIGVTHPRNEQLADKLCPNRRDPADTCMLELDAQVRNDVMFYEGVAHASISTLDRLMAELGSVPERKTLVLVSGGIISADSPGYRPDNHLLGIEAGRTAARANVSVYSINLDQMWMKSNSAESGRALSSQTMLRDSNITGKWLDELAGGSGGSYLRVSAGNGASAFDRVLRETSAYYLLGVEPAAAERDGRPYEMRVKVNVPGVNVQGRSWVVIPKPGEAEARAAARRTASAPTSASALPSSVPAPSAAVPPPPPAVKALADAYDKDDLAAIVTALAPRGADTLIEQFRKSQSPWPTRPKWTAAFALDLALVGLRSDSPFVKEASMRLLAEYAVRVRQPNASDVFECTWFWTASAGVQGMYTPDTGTLVAERGAERCPSDPNLRLGLAVVLDQQLTMNRTSPALRRTVAAGAMTEAERRVLAAYDAAAGSASTRYEARVRAAYLHLRVGRYADGLALFENIGQLPGDPDLEYAGALIHGQLLSAAGRSDEALDVLRRAVAIRPTAQSGRVALMNELVLRGDTEEAVTLAKAVWATSPTERDPWWLYFLGDFRAYPTIRARLREVAK